MEFRYDPGMRSTKGDIAMRIIEARGADVVEARRRVLKRGSGAAIHDLRVATRRLQAALEVFGPRLPERPRRRLDRRARLIRRRLGPARNTRVLKTMLRRLRVRPHSDESRLVAGMLRRLDRQDRGNGGAGRPPLPGIRKRLRALLRGAAGWPGGPAAPAGAALPGRVEAVALAASMAGDGDPESMHRLRIAVKRYRYVLEIPGEAGDRSVESSIRAARDVQRALGRLHDLDVLIEWVRDGVHAPAAAAFLRRLLRLRGRQVVRAQRRLARFHPAGTRSPRRTAA